MFNVFVARDRTLKYRLRGSGRRRRSQVRELALEAPETGWCSIKASVEHSLISFVSVSHALIGVICGAVAIILLLSLTAIVCYKIRQRNLRSILVANLFNIGNVTPSLPSE